MKKQPILDTIDPEITERLVTRREAISHGASVSSVVAAGLAFGSVPIALATLTRDVYSQAPEDILDVLEFAFLLENIESEFYQAVLGQSETAAQNDAFAPVRAQLTPTETATLDQIRKHEEAHVAFLRSAIQSLGGTPIAYTGASFDFTGGAGSGDGPFLPATQDKLFLLAATQAFEDTGVRAYKGQAGNLISNNDVLQAALQIHSVEARHAAKIRKMRREAGAPPEVRLSGTIRQDEAGVPGAPSDVADALALIYGGEANTAHTVHNGTAAATIDAATLVGIVGGVDAVTEAFDEPLSRDVVEQIVTPFVVPD